MAFDLIKRARERCVSIRSHRNASFVSVLLEKYFHVRLVKVSGTVGVSPEVIINNTMILALKELESMARSQEYENHQTDTRTCAKIPAKQP